MIGYITVKGQLLPFLRCCRPQTGFDDNKTSQIGRRFEKNYQKIFVTTWFHYEKSSILPNHVERAAVKGQNLRFEWSAKFQLCIASAKLKQLASLSTLVLILNLFLTVSAKETFFKAVTLTGAGAPMPMPTISPLSTPESKKLIQSKI